MNTLSTTKMSSRGQVVIPENIREELGLSLGTQFVVVGEKDTIILKTITPPSNEGISALLASARKAAKKAEAKKSDVNEAIQKSRRHKK